MKKIAFLISLMFSFQSVAAEDPVVAKIGTVEIKRSYVTEMMNSLPAMNIIPVKELFPLLLPDIANTVLLAEAARAENMHQDPAFVTQMKVHEDIQLQKLYIQKKIKDLLTDDVLKAEYDRITADPKFWENALLYVITVRDEELGQQIIEKLAAGENFGDLANQYSTHPTAKQSNGLMGMIRRDELPDYLAPIVFSQEVGQWSAEPIYYRGEYHIYWIKKMSTTPPLSFEEMKKRIHRKMYDKKLSELLAKQAEVNNVTLHGYDGASEGEE